MLPRSRAWLIPLTPSATGPCRFLILGTVSSSATIGNCLWQSMRDSRGKFWMAGQSGITTFQTGFPIRITSQADVELQGSFDFETPGQPNIAAPFKSINPRKLTCAAGTGTDPTTCTLINAGFNPDAFTNNTVTPGTIGNAPRTVCCGPGLNNWEFSFQKQIPVSERVRFEFH